MPDETEPRVHIVLKEKPVVKNTVKVKLPENACGSCNGTGRKYYKSMYGWGSCHRCKGRGTV